MFTEYCQLKRPLPPNPYVEALTPAPQNVTVFAAEPLKSKLRSSRRGAVVNESD